MKDKVQSVDVLGERELTKVKEKNQAQERNGLTEEKTVDKNNNIGNITRNGLVRGDEQQKYSKQGKSNKEIQENKSKNTPRIRSDKESKTKIIKSRKTLQKSGKESMLFEVIYFSRNTVMKISTVLKCI